MTGAAHLAGMAALRAGAGLVTLGVPEAVYSVIARRELEIMTRSFKSTPQGTLALQDFSKIRKCYASQDVLAIGPGLSRNNSTQKLIRKILKDTDKPVVLDADGVNALSGFCGILDVRKAPTILTPHPGEFKGAFDLNVSDAGEDRKRKAKQVAKRFRSVLVLKGHRTVVASPDGKIYVNRTGNPGMATAGMGDVLTGIIAALLGQGLFVFEAACLGVYVHGLAGDLAAKKVGETSLIACDVLEMLPQAFRKTAKS